MHMLDPNPISMLTLSSVADALLMGPINHGDKNPPFKLTFLLTGIHAAWH